MCSKATGTTWEDYYRYDPEQVGNGNQVPSVSKLLFRQSGTADLGNAGNGFLVDDLTLASSATTTACAFTTSGTTMTLVADCETDHTILVPNGFTLDGAGNTITAVDPAGGHFLGAVVRNGGTTANVTNLEITASGSPTSATAAMTVYAASSSTTRRARSPTSTCTASARDSRVARKGTRSRSVTSHERDAALAVTIANNTVTDYQKNGITVNGAVSATVTGNTVTGAGPITYIAQNGIQVGFGATAFIRGNAVSGNDYTPAGTSACGLLFFDAAGVKQQANHLFANEVNLCNFGRGGGKGNPSS